MRRPAFAAGRDGQVRHAGALGAGCAAEIALEDEGGAVLALARLDVLDVDDRGRALRRLPHLGLPCGRLADVRALSGADQRDVGEPGVHPGDACAREHRVPVPDAVPEGQHPQPVRPGAERVCLTVRQVDETVAFADLVDLPALPRQAASLEDVEQLLRGALDVRRRRPLPRVDLDQRDPDTFGAGGASEVAPGAADVPRLAARALHVVPVRQVLHGGQRYRPRPASKPRRVPSSHALGSDPQSCPPGTWPRRSHAGSGGRAWPQEPRPGAWHLDMAGVRLLTWPEWTWAAARPGRRGTRRGRACPGRRGYRSRGRAW